MQKWIHIQFNLEGAFANRVWAAYHRSRRTLPPIPPDAGELAIHLTTRLNMLPRLAGRLNRGNTEILKAVKAASRDHVSAPGAPGYALDVDDDLKFEFLLDVDALLFEMNALCEIIGLFVARIHALAGEPIKEGRVGATLKRIVGKQSADTAWFATLDALRNLFIHAAAPYLAADVSTTEPELVIMKRNVGEFSDPTEFVRMSELRLMVRGFRAAVEAVERYLAEFLCPAGPS